MRNLLTSMLAIAVAACSAQEPQSAGGAAKIVGLTSNDDSSFTMTSDGTALAIMYRTARIEAQAKGKVKEGDVVSMTRKLSMVTAPHPATFRVFVSGFVSPEAQDPKLAFTIDGQNSDLKRQIPPSVADGNFIACFDVPFRRSNNKMVWTASVKTPAEGKTGGFQIDTVDLVVIGPEADTLPEQGCPLAPDKK